MAITHSKQEFHKYLLHVADENQIEEMEKVVIAAVFKERIENELLATQWINPLNIETSVFVKDIRYIDYLGPQVVEFDIDWSKQS